MPGEEMLRAWGQDVDAWYGLLRQLTRVVQAHACRATGDACSTSSRFVQIGFKVVGVGSVGTRAWILLLDGADAADPLFLQAKEAQRSVLADYVKPARRFANQGERVVRGQRLTQMTSDIFLGWQRVDRARRRAAGLLRPPTARRQGIRRRREPGPAMMAFYARLCGQTLARAHARSGDRVAIAAYLGKSDRSTTPSPTTRWPTPSRTSSITPPSRRPSHRADWSRARESEPTFSARDPRARSARSGQSRPSERVRAGRVSGCAPRPLGGSSRPACGRSNAGVP